MKVGRLTVLLNWLHILLVSPNIVFSSQTSSFRDYIPSFSFSICNSQSGFSSLKKALMNYTKIYLQQAYAPKEPAFQWHLLKPIFNALHQDPGRLSIEVFQSTSWANGQPKQLEDNLYRQDQNLLFSSVFSTSTFFGFACFVLHLGASNFLLTNSNNYS